MLEIVPRRSADCGRVFMLASVVDAREAIICRKHGADIIDCKDPAQGALGAVAESAARAIVEAVGDWVPVSATIGDLPCEVEPIKRETLRMAATGVDYVKIGFAPGGDAAPVMRALGRLKPKLGKSRLVGVLFADADPDVGLLDEMARAGFAGVVLDTADKSAGALPDVMGPARLEEFIDRAHANGLFCGLAGSLRLRDVPVLTRLAPDLLGFRGALCRGCKRTASLEAAAVAEIRNAIDRAVKAGTDHMMAKPGRPVHEERA